MIFNSTRKTRRHKNNQKTEKVEQPFFAMANDAKVQKKEQPFFQTKLTIGQPGDQYEKEADAVADTVVNNDRKTPAVQEKEISGIQRATLASPEEYEKLNTAEGRMEKDKLIQEQAESGTPEEEDLAQTKEEEEEQVAQMQAKEEEQPIQETHAQGKKEEEMENVQTKSAHRNHQASSMVSKGIKQTKGGGRKLPTKVRTEMESSIGRDFSQVNIHTGTDAIHMNKDLHAQAFTHGKDIYFNSGKYRPETSAGKHLLAHELAHVVQQNKLQDKKDIRQIQLSARGETESSQAGTNEEEVSCLSETELDEIEARFRDMIQRARDEEGADVAADNLEYFLAGSGAKKIISVSWLRSFSEVLEAESRNESRFENSLIDKADGMKDGETKTFTDFWDAQLIGGITTELYYASGTSTINSTGEFSLTRSGDIVTITGTVKHHWHDSYDWHPGLSAWIPGFGSISDSDGLMMQSCRGAKPFEMEADWTKTVGGTVKIMDYWFNPSEFTWSGP